MSNELAEVAVLPSGAKLELQHAPFSVSHKLLKVVMRELAAVPLGLNIDVNFASDPAALAALLSKDVPLDLLKNGLCQLIASDAIEQALGECMARCLYEGRAIGKDTFENSNARGDFLPAAWEVMKLNLLPFFSGLLSKSLTGKNPAGASRS